MQKLVLLIAVVALLSTCSQPKSETSSVSAPVEMGDSTKTSLCKASYTALIAGDVDAFAASMSDDVVFRWNAGDSIAGKAAVIEYWKDRRENVIDQLAIKNDIWLPLKVNTLSNLTPGEYVLMWADLTSTYQFGGTTMNQRIHRVHRFNKEGKIDYITHYIDRYDVANALRPAK
jgi:ketosteroid isomerase-like protein